MRYISGLVDSLSDGKGGLPDQAPLPVGMPDKLAHVTELQELVDFGQHGMKVRFRYQAPDGVAVPPSGIEYAADVEVPLAL